MDTNQNPPVEVPEKFRGPDGTIDMAAFVKSYTELEKTHTQLRQGQPPVNQPPVNQPPATPPAVAPATFPTQQVLQLFQAQGGKLSDQQYAALAQRGFDRSTVDTVIEGGVATATARAAKVYEKFGGKETYDAMAAWAGANFSAEEKAEFNKTLNHGSAAAIDMAVTALKARYEASNGSTGTYFEGAPGGGVSPFRSSGEMTAAMKDPRYKTDKAYRAEVERKTMAMQLG